MENTTIAAISTAYGEAGIGIVRMSGPGSFDVLEKVFFSKKGEKIAFEPRHMYYGVVKDEEGRVIDEALAVYMKAPYTYTGEDVAEIQCHGGNISVRNILSLLLRSGAVLAERGEFTKRAFLSGKLDLSQAEAVIDLIKARTGKSYDTAVGQLEGSLSRKIRDIRKELLDLLVSITVNMDYPDEDIEELTYETFGNSVSQINDELSKLSATSGEGRILREGLKVAIVGKPNVGKSSLMNIFLKENRSIVTDVPGTTRDTIEESASVRGIPISFIDTAGIHDSEDLVESMGIERSREAFNRADLLILVLDGSSELTKEDEELISMSRGRNCITLLNKADKGLVIKEKGIEVSMLEETGIDLIEDEIERFVNSGRLRREDDVIVTSVRHAELLRRASEELKEASAMIEAGEAMDFIEVNVKSAFDLLGEITGETASDEVIDEVFSRFCLGK